MSHIGPVIESTDSSAGWFSLARQITRIFFLKVPNPAGIVISSFIRKKVLVSSAPSHISYHVSIFGEINHKCFCFQMINCLNKALSCCS